MCGCHVVIADIMHDTLGILEEAGLRRLILRCRGNGAQSLEYF